jgi:DNA-binding NarL/FixJ family response regulator
MAPPAPIRLALVDDYDVILAGVAHMFDRYADRVTVVELDANVPVAEDVDVVLFDAYAQPEADVDLVTVVQNPHARRVAVYTWTFRPALVEAALDKGARGYLSKALPAREMVAAIEAIHAGEIVVSEAPTGNKLTVGLDWPGRSEGLSERESEVLALITQGKTNAEIADIVYLSMNSIKTYIRSAYRKIGVTSRVEAVLWGIEHGFRPDYRRVETWRPPPGA